MCHVAPPPALCLVFPPSWLVSCIPDQPPVYFSPCVFILSLSVSPPFSLLPAAFSWLSFLTLCQPVCSAPLIPLTFPDPAVVFACSCAALMLDKNFVHFSFCPPSATFGSTFSAPAWQQRVAKSMLINATWSRVTQSMRSDLSWILCESKKYSLYYMYLMLVSIIRATLFM